MNNNNPIDIRLIVENSSNMELVSKAMNDITLGVNFNITFSSIIPYTTLEITKKAVHGADLVLIINSTDNLNSNSNTYINSLKKHAGQIEIIQLNNNDPETIKNQITNTIIKTGLKSLINIKKLNEYRNETQKAIEKCEKYYTQAQTLNNDKKQSTKQIDELKYKIELLEAKSQAYYDEIEDLKKENKEYKQHFENHMIELFNLQDLWEENFNETLEDVEKINIVTSNFKPNDIIIGQGYIAAPTKQEAIDWLKIIKTALIFIENDNQLKEDLQEYEYIPEKHNPHLDDDDEDDDEENMFSGFWD